MNRQLLMEQARIKKLPLGWDINTVEASCRIRNDLRKPISVEEREKMQGRYPYYGPTGILSFINEFLVEGRYCLIGEDGDHFLKYVEKDQTILIEGKFNVNNHAHIIEGTASCSVEWFFQYFKHRNITPFLSRQGAGRYKLNKETLQKLPILLPSFHEQTAIANLLSTWDEAINKAERLIAAKEKQLRFQREQYLHESRQQKRVKLQAVTSESTARNGERLGRESVMAVTKQAGMRPMKEETISATIERYKIVRPLAFAYNPMRINIGSIVISPFNTDVLVSPDYVVFECDETKLLPGYLNHLRHSRHWASYFENAGSGSVRVRIYYDDLAAFTFALPPLEEQKRIAALLDAASQEIDLLKKQADALRRQKRGLMQKLLTGVWRVKTGGES